MGGEAMDRRRAFLALTMVALAIVAAGCNGGAGTTVPHAAPGLVNADAIMQAQTPKSGGFRIESGRTMPESAAVAMTASSARNPQSELLGNAWTQLSSGISYVAASPDGTVWGISNSSFNGPDGLVLHYVSGTWYYYPNTYASRVAVGLDSTAYIQQNNGNVWVLKNGLWSIVGCCALDVSVAADGSLYAVALANDGLYHYASGVLTQLPGVGVRIVGSWDTGTYPNGVNPGGYYVVNAQGSLYYYSPGVGYLLFQGSLYQVAPTGNGGMFGTGLAADSNGNHQVYYYDLRAQTGWVQQPGGAASISAISTTVDIADGLGIVYSSGVAAAGSTVTPPLTGPNAGAYNVWGPTAVANALQFPVQSGYNGAGITIAVIDDSTILAGDLASYLTELQTPLTSRTFTAEAVAGAALAPIPSELLEPTLDMETVMGLAPGASVIEYVTPDLTTQSLLSAYNQIIAEGRATIASVSLGSCEGTMSNSQLLGLDAIFSQANQAGLAFIASAGDQGSACSNGSNGYQFGVNYPASDPNVIGVGGTETVSPVGQITSLTSNIAWNDVYFGNPLATGGGLSTFFSLPAYQSGLPALVSRQARNVPDIAMPAVGDIERLQGNWDYAGGTSWGAPQFAAMLAEVYQFCGVTRVQNPASIPYVVYNAAGYKAFVDVVSGNNSFPIASGPTFGYSAGPGYDNVSGIGVPLGMPFANALCPNHVLLAGSRRPIESLSLPARPAAAYNLDATPKLAGLTDLGPRSPQDVTPIEVVVSPSGSIAANEQNVIAALESAGLSITRTYSNHLLVEASGPAAAVEQLFSTRLHNVAQAGHNQAYMPVSPVTVPASIASAVASIILDDVVTFSRIGSRTTSPQASVKMP